MQTIERTISVPTPLAQVWDYLLDFTNTEEWDPPTESTTRVTGDGGVGTVYRNVTSMLGNKVETKYTVAEVVPHRTLRLEGENSSMKLHDTISFSSDEGGTTVTYRAEFEPTGAAKLVEPLMPLGLKRLGDKTADQLEECLRQLPG
ncbi:polyketide cyclase [Nocardioides silvaticus]|uniref:Polyketide cyclase n=1 Tax=Nocardioides silvaticus TaxID=2201891 RepID=A0A316TC92_9ACTN|nr:SRPBCC family protein [Nocardioides silvaticus]PWN01993.1 polyketide cyclase [Nocardioides silvaticus]